MTKKLRKHIMFFMTLLLSITFITIIIAINIGIRAGDRSSADDSLRFLIQRETSPRDSQNDIPPHDSQDDTPPPKKDDTQGHSQTQTGQDNTSYSETQTEGQHNTPYSETQTEEQHNIPYSEAQTEGQHNTPYSETQTEGQHNAPSTVNNDTAADNAPNNNTSTVPPAPSDLPPEKPLDAPNRHTEIMTAHYILAKYSLSESLLSIENTLSDAYTNEEIEEYCEELLQKGKEQGTIDQLRYSVHKGQSEIIIAFIDYSSSVQSGRNLLIISIVSSVACLVLFSILSYILSGMMVAPVEDAFERQKQFISDASHELKTPIAVILANSELLEDQFGETKQLSYIKKECDQMHHLVTSLLNLTRLEQTPYTDVPKNSFSISDAILEQILPLESIAYENGVTLNYSGITPDISFYGVKEQIQQLTTILVDNALTHTDEKGLVYITLKKSAHHVTFTVSNTGEEIPKEEREKLFQRFYRSDKSRHRASGHFGLGLSIAKTIVTNHRGKITVECENGVTSFIVSLRTS